MFNPMLKNKKYIAIGIITLVLAVGIAGVKAVENRNINDLIELAKVVNESNSDVIADAISFLNENSMLGASGTRFPNGISADSTSPSAGEVRGTTFTSTGDLTVGDDLTVTGDTISVEGVVDEYSSDVMAQATTSPCSIQSPTTASSTLLHASASFSVSTTTAFTLVVAQGADTNATTTQIGSDFAITANAQATVIASTTPIVATDGVTVFAPGQFLNWSMQAVGTTGTFSPTGTCKAQFRRTD